jgi:3-hydroxyacyl-[acyl-carrier-protein] dehydratase
MSNFPALASLPHGPEFRFVDEILSLEPGRSGSACFTLKGTEEFLRGHFPGAPIMPGVLMIEALAQLAGIVAQCDPAHPPLANMRLTAVRAAKILGTFGPGDTVTLTTTIVGRMGNLIQAEGTLQHQEKELLRAQVTLSGDPPSIG